MQLSCDTVGTDLGMRAIMFRPEAYQDLMQRLGDGPLAVEVANFNS